MLPNVLQISPDQVIAELARHIGADSGIHVAELVRRISGQPVSSALLERKVRQHITDLRLQGHHICGHPASGYYMAANGRELDATCAYLRARAMSSLVIISKLQGVAMPELMGQMSLAT